MEARFSILTFPQSFDGDRLHLRILVVPRLGTAWNGDPLHPVVKDFPQAGDTAPAFADAELRFEARVLDGFARFPVSAPIDFSAPLPGASGVMPDARALYTELVANKPGRFKLAAANPKLAEPVKAEIFIKKYLPKSYRQSFLFTGPRTGDASTGDAYHCAVRAAKPPNPAFVETPDTVNWGQVYAYCLRHPQLARKLGLIRSASFKLPPKLFDDGGFLYVDLAPQSDYAEQIHTDFDFLKRYAARIPSLKTRAKRQLFAAVQFPVLFDDPAVPGPPAALGNFDAVFIEAADYDDGFAKIVHATQPVSQNLLAEAPDGFAPLTDIGIRLGWDDEQILIWQNRQLKADPTVPKIGGQPQRLDAPMGVFGYRIDAREHGAAWHSLVHVRSKAPLTLGAIDLGERANQKFDGELAVEVHPMQLDGNQTTGQFWLPAYLAQWNGKSLVIPDEDAAAIYHTEKADASLARVYDPVGLQNIPLRYGKTYDFRVRLMDPTGGGPGPSSDPVYDAPSPVVTVAFRRHVVFEPVRLVGMPEFPPPKVMPPSQDADGFFLDDELEIPRPLLNYPSVVFTGKYNNPIPLLQAASNAAVGKESFGIPDPDATRVRIDVEVRTLRLDNRLSLSGRENYIHLYTTTRDFPADPAKPRVVPLRFSDAAVIRFGDPNDFGDLKLPGDVVLTQAAIDAMDELLLPTAREVRLTIRAIADDDPGYFAAGAHIGKAVQLRVHRPSADESKLIAAFNADKMIRGIYLQPDPPTLFDGTVSALLFHRSTGDTPAIVQRLAQQIGVDFKGLTLEGKKGERVIFGCSRRIRHTLAPDNSSITFAAKEDLVNHWIVPLMLQLDRDWTWDGLEEVSFDIFRTQRFTSDPLADADDNGNRPIGDWEAKRVAPVQALDGANRDHTTLIFFDAVEPKSDKQQAAAPSETRFPDTIELSYRIAPHLSEAPAPADEPVTLSLKLPVTTPPAQVPRIVSAGVALSKYQRDVAYSKTEPRRRFLWLELEETVRDPNDGYFIRLLGYAPDPMISDDRIDTFIPPEEAPLPIDPELIRVIPPNDTDDRAGFSAMVPLEAGGNVGRHFLVPLPPGLNSDSPELFGFFTYELRVGHSNIWSTAQGRFGRAFRTTGVQHPPPTLFCTCQRTQKELVVEAPYAEAVLAGKNITANPPRTEIWALLYAQVRQADGKDFRNILLEDRGLLPVPRIRQKFEDPAGKAFVAFQNRDAPIHGVTGWTQAEVLSLLRELGLPTASPLSVLCVETLPTLENQKSAVGTGRSFVDADIAASVLKERGGQSLAAARAPADGRPRPLSDALGHVRIMRTSPLTPVPDVC
jgi:hypothetical protein